MTTQHNPYATPPGIRTSTSLKEYADPMEEASPKTPDSSQGNGTNSDQSGQEQSQQENNDDLDVEEDEPLPPSYHHTITEEQLRDDDCPYVFWASL